jgi:hypothetical protein
LNQVARSLKSSTIKGMPFQQSNDDSLIVVNELFYENPSLPCRRQFYLFWLAVGLIFIALSFIYFWYTEEPVFIFTAVPLSIGILAVPFGVKLGAIVLNAWGEDIPHFVMRSRKELRVWFHDQAKVFAGQRVMWFVGILFGFLSLVAFYCGGTFSRLHTGVGVILAIIIISAGFNAGVAGFNVFCLSRLIWRVGKFPIKVEPSPFGVMTTGRTLAKCYLLAGIIWSTFTLSSVTGFSPCWLPMVVIALPTIVFFAASFIICQIPMHQQMINFKRAELLKIDHSLESFRSLDVADLNEEKRKQVEFFEKRLVAIIALPEWPFGWKALSAAVISGIASVLPALISFSLGFLKSASGGSAHSP